MSTDSTTTIPSSFPQPLTGGVSSLRRFLKNLTNLWQYASTHDTEYHLYGAINLLFTTFCLHCKHIDEDVLIFLHPQNELKGLSLQRVMCQRYPDYVVLGTYNQPFPNKDPRYKKAFLGFWIEVKPLSSGFDWFSKYGRLRSAGAVAYHLGQVSDQAHYAFQQYGMTTYRAMLVIGLYFTLLEYTNVPTLTEGSSVGTFGPNPDSWQPKQIPTTPHRASKRSAPSLSPLSSNTSPPSGTRRRKRQMINTPSPDASASSEPSPQPEVDPLSGIPPPPSVEAALLIPKIIYFHEQITSLDGEYLEPRFLKALQLATEKMNVNYDGSFFACPPGEHLPSTGSYDFAEAAIAKAFASHPEITSESESESPDPSSPPYQASPEVLSRRRTQPFVIPPPLTRRMMKDLAKSSRVQDLTKNAGLSKDEAIKVAVDEQRTQAHSDVEDSFFTDGGGDRAEGSSAHGSHRNLFHETLAARGGSNSVPSDDGMSTAARVVGSSDEEICSTRAASPKDHKETWVQGYHSSPSLIPSDVEPVPSSPSGMSSNFESIPSEPDDEEEDVPCVPASRHQGTSGAGSKSRDMKGKGRTL